MKKIAVLLSMLICAVLATAQTTNGYVEMTPDSTVGVETIYLGVSDAEAITRNHVVTLTLIPVNSSGTETVKCTPQGSLNGTKYFDLQSVADTINNAGTIAEVKYEYSNANWRYYRLALVASGSGTTTYTGQLGLKKNY